MSQRNLKAWMGAIALGLAAQGAQAGVIWAANGHEYDVISAEGITWTAAQAATAALGSGWHLATVTSSAEDSFVAGLLPVAPASRSHYWLGGSDAGVENTWTWVTGEAFSYTNWWGGEPNNSGNEDFLAYDYRGSWGWNDAADTVGRDYGFLRGYVIERSGSGAVPLPGTLPLLVLGLGLAGVAARRQRRR